MKVKIFSKQKLMKKSALRKQFAATKKPQDKIKKSIISPHAQGNVTGALSSARDITEQKKAEEALRLANAYNRSLIEASLDPLVTIGADGKIMDVNNATEAATGYSRQELIGRDFSDYFTEPEKARSGYQQVFKEGSVHDYPLEIRHRDGHIIPVLYNASVYRDETGKVAGVFAAARDITERKKAEEALKESEARLNFAMQMTHTGIWDLDLIDHTAHRSLVHDQIFGYEKLLPEWTYEMFLEHVLPEDRPEVARLFQRAIAAQTNWDFECRIRRTDGEVRWIWAVGEHEQNPEGKPVRMSGVVQDITERKKKEAELAVAQRLYRELFENIDIGILRSTPGQEGAFIDVNPAMVRMFEADSREQLMALHPSEIYWDESQRKIVSDAIIAKGFIDEEVKYKTLKGKMIWCHIHSVKKNDADGRIYFDNTIENITGHKQAEEAVAASQKFLQDVTDNIPSLVYACDLQGRFMMVNRDLESLLGLPRESVIGKRREEILPPEVATAHRNNDRKVINALKPIVAEEEHNEPDGIHTYLSVKFPIISSQGNVQGVGGISTDITERKRTEEKIKKLNEELEQRVAVRTARLEAVNKELEAFAYSVSHDLRAPLRGIDGWSLALLQDYGERLNDEARGYIHRVRTETQQMGRLIDDMLKLSQVTRAEMQLMPTDLTAKAQSITVHLQEERPQRNMEFIIQPALRANGDSHLLDIALSNLFDNAVKFTGTRSHARIEFGEAEVDGGKAFFVRDNGVGFDMAFADRLFGAFQRLHKSSEFPGTGIGLATVQRIIHRHGGRIWADAQVDKGATFYFTLTLKETV